MGLAMNYDVELRGGLECCCGVCTAGGGLAAVEMVKYAAKG